MVNVAPQLADTHVRWGRAKADYEAPAEGAERSCSLDPAAQFLRLTEPVTAEGWRAP